MTEPRSLFVGVANGTYASEEKLERAVPDTQAVANALAELSNYETEVFADRGMSLLGGLKTILRPDSLIGGRLILSWVGHGKEGRHGLQFIVPDYENKVDVDYGDISTLVADVMDTGARQILLIIDTCRSGGAFGVIAAAALAGLRNRLADKEAWVGAVAASQSYEDAVSGLLIGEVHRLLTKGPGEEKKSQWPKLRPAIDGPTLVETLIGEWADSRQTLQQQNLGGWPGTGLVANPRNVGGGIGQPLEHLLFAARGSSTDQNFFTGRTNALKEIVAWMAKATPGLFVVTGPPGCGKSAIVGRIISLASTEERANILQMGSVPAAVDPGQGSVDVQLQLRRANVNRAVESISEQLEFDATSSFEVLTEARCRARAGRPAVIVIDGLDEAGDFAWSLATELIEPLAREALVLIASRDLALNDQASLIASLGRASSVIDLGDDPDATKRSVHRYVISRLEGVDTNMDAERVADVLAGTGADTNRDVEAPFLFARLVTAQLRANPVDTSAESWADELASSVASALEFDLKSVSIKVGGSRHPSAARELLRAVAYSYGNGFPADVWAQVASVLSGTQYTQEDVYGAMDTLARHLIVGIEGDQPTYRLAHQRLVDHLRDDSVPTVSDQVHQAVAQAIANLYEDLLAQHIAPQNHPYLWHYAWAHFADAEMKGMELFQNLAQHDVEAFSPDLAVGFGLVGARMRMMGRIQDAQTAGERAVALRRAIGPPVELAMALFDHATTLSFADPDDANERTTEALNIARKYRDQPEGRAAFAQGITTSALTELRRGNVRWAYELANEAVTLWEREVAEDLDQRYAMTPAQSLLAETAAGMFDLEVAEQTANSLLNTARDPDAPKGTAIFADDAVATLLHVRVMRALMSGQRGEEPEPIETEIGEDLWRMVQETGPTKSMIDVVRGRGLVFLSQILVTNEGLGVESTLDIRAVLDTSIDLLTPFSAGDANVANLLAVALELRASQRVDGAEDEEEATRILRKFADHNGHTAFVLGVILDGRAQKMLAASPPTHGSVNEELIDLMYDAVAYLRVAADLPNRAFQLGTALSRLAVLLIFVNQREIEEVVRDEAIMQFRELRSLGAPGADFWLCTNLVDQSGRILVHRPVEAIAYGQEALDILAVCDPDVSWFRGFSALAQISVATARLALGETERVREQLEDAILLLPQTGASPVEMGLLACALTNKAAVELLEKSFSAGREAAQAALELLDMPDVFISDPNLRTLAELHLARAEKALGNAAGLVKLRSILAEMKHQMINGSLPPENFAGMLNVSGRELWDEALEGLAEHPDLIRHLTLYRDRPSNEIELKIADLIDVESRPDDLDLRIVHSAIRSHRAKDPATFDAIWRERMGDLPHWLTIDSILEHRVIAWWNAHDLVGERAYLLENSDLLSPSTDLLIEELRTSLNAHERATHLADILEQARRIGVEAAYAPFLAWDLIGNWINSNEPQQFLEENPALQGRVVAEVLESELEDDLPESYPELEEYQNGILAALQAVLFLARRGEQALAFLVADDPSEVTKQLRESLRSGDLERLTAIALIGMFFADRQRRVSAFGLAIAWAIQGPADRAVNLVGSMGQIDNAEKDAMTKMITGALKANPEQGVELARLLAAIPNVDGATS